MTAIARKTIASTFIGRLAAALVIVGLLIANPAPVSAQCETSIEAVIKAGVATGISVGALIVQREALKPAILAILNLTLYVPLMEALDSLESKIIARLNEFWEDWLKAMKDQTRQLHSSYIDQARQMGSFFDAGVVQQMKRATEPLEAEAKLAYMPTDEGCRFDTVARYKGTTARQAKAMTTAIAAETTAVGGNRVGTPGAAGDANLRDTRWNRYVTHFCDPTANAGFAGCDAPGDNMGAHITPSKTLFGKDTWVDADEERNRLAMNELIFNITGYEPVEPMEPDTLSTPIGIEQRQKNREYLTQMDAVTSLVSPIIADRLPGIEAPEIKAMREKMGILTAADRPSVREIRLSTIEQLWDPSYFVNLGQGGSTIAQKEVYLQSYHLQLLYNVIEKTEKIANIYAVQGGNMLEQRGYAVRDGGITYTRTGR